MSVIQTSLSGSTVGIGVASGLDEIFSSGFEMEKQPGETRADDSLFFRQDSTDLLAVQYAEQMGPGDFNQTSEDEEVDDASIRLFNKTTAEVFEYDRDVGIPQRFQEASSMYGVVDRAVMELGIRGRTSRDKYAFLKSYGDAFSGVTTPDGVALISASHVSGSGDTIDNAETAAASADGVFTCVKTLRLMKAQDGDLASYKADGLLGPVNLHPTLTEVTKSELKSGTGNNNLNYFSQVYPGLVVGASEYLDATYNTANSNANTSYFVVSRMHSITRAVRVPLATEYVEPKFDRKRRAFYRARFSERVYAGSWGGIVGSTGTA